MAVVCRSTDWYGRTSSGRQRAGRGRPSLWMIRLIIEQPELYGNEPVGRGLRGLYAGGDTVADMTRTQRLEALVLVATAIVANTLLFPVVWIGVVADALRKKDKTIDRVDCQRCVWGLVPLFPSDPGCRLFTECPDCGGTGIITEEDNDG